MTDIIPSRAAADIAECRCGGDLGNLYANPENYGLAPVAEIEYSFPWAFDMIVVWRCGGALFYGQSEGCSCPSPFEEEHFHSVNDTTLNRLTPEQFAAFDHEVREWATQRYRDADERPDPGSVSSFLQTVWQALSTG